MCKLKQLSFELVVLEKLSSRSSEFVLSIWLVTLLLLVWTLRCIDGLGLSFVAWTLRLIKLRFKILFGRLL